MPVTNDSLQELSDIVNKLCGIGVVADNQPPINIQPEVTGNSEHSEEEGILFEQLQITLDEAISEVTETKTQMQDWMALIPPTDKMNFAANVKKAFQTLRCNCRTLNAEGNSRLDILIQISCFARFLKAQENDVAYGDTGEQIKLVKLKILQFGRYIRKLLPLVTEDIYKYVVSGNANKGLLTGNYTSALKRAVVSSVIELMLLTIRKITVSVDTGSVTMA